MRTHYMNELDSARQNLIQMGETTMTLLAEAIGTTRETVSRLFSDFKRRQLVQLKGATLVIRSRPALEKIVQS